MDAELRTALDDLRRRVDGVLAAPVLGDPADKLRVLREAVGMRPAVEGVLAAAVREARDDGATWQSVGDLLGVSRQAAFQRWGRPIDPRTGELMNTTPLADAAALAAAVVHDLSTARWSAVVERFDETMGDALSAEALTAAWAQIVGIAGAFESMDEPTASRAADLTITQTPLHFEAGDFTASVVFRDDRTIAGLHILPAPGAAS